MRLAICLLLWATASALAVEKRDINPARPSSKLKDEVEGSADEPTKGSSDLENKGSTGYGHDDEDSVHGSGDDKVEGSGGGDGVVLISPITTTTTTTPAPLPAITVRTTTTTTTEVFVPEIVEMSTVKAVTTTRIPPRVTTTDSSLPFHTMLKPGIFAAVVGGTVVGLLMAILLVMFIVYRMRKRDEGSYALEEPKQRPYAGYAYTKASSTKEFYA